MKYSFLLLTWLVVLLSPTPLHAASWAVQGHDSQNTNFSPRESAISRDDVARLHATWSINGGSEVVAAGGRLYLSFTAGGGVGVIDADRGRQIRRFTLHNLGFSFGDNVNAMAYGDGLLVVASFLQIIAINPAYGTIAWRREGGADALVLSSGIVYTGQGCQTGCGTAAVEALDLRSGRMMWQIRETSARVRYSSEATSTRPGGETGCLPTSMTQGPASSFAPSLEWPLWTGNRDQTYVVHGNGSAFGPRQAQALSKVGTGGTEESAGPAGKYWIC